MTNKIKKSKIEIKKQPVSSSTAEALGYDEKTKTLRVWFTTGKIYDYAHVPKTRFKAFLYAPSIGEYFNRSIKGIYPYTQVS
ncbi:MAG TPA: KTSC domain-containing protein [Hanamia sp.]|jgi:KTSC domain|nr:KTSC domain-containing protein [Hanamia sp.]